MIKVNNIKAIKNIADKSFIANKSRNIIAVIAIALTAVLFTTLFTIGTGTVESLQKATMRQAGGDGHAVLKYISDDAFNKVKSHPLIKEIAYDRSLCDEVKNVEFLKRRTEFWYHDDVGMKLGFTEPTKGHKPIAENEVIADSKTLQLLGVPLQVGAPLTLTLKIRGEEIQRNFILSGWWESDPVVNVGQIIASRAYLDAHSQELKCTYKKDYSMTGAINAYIMFGNTVNLQGKLEKVIMDSGFSMDKNNENYVDNNLNWSYLSANISMDAGTVVTLIAGLLLVILTGYLIIYNIFQISVIKDIRFYGLLKTIGTTGKQIRRIIRRQALRISLVAIPLGLLIGFFIGKALVPVIMSNSTYAGSAISVSPKPFIFIGSAIFALITVLISTFKPGRIAASVSPIEAVRYTDEGSGKSGKLKKSTDGAKMTRMALSNLGRNRKRTVLVLISLSLSLILLNTVFTLSRSIDMDKYLSKFSDTDFLIAHAEYFQNKFYGPENQTSESFISAVGQQPGFEEGGRLYSGKAEMFAVEDSKNSSQKYNMNTFGHFFSQVYGLEKLPLQRLEMIDGELDYEKLASGKYIIEGIELDDNNIPVMNSAHFKVGDKVTLHNYKGTSERFEDREYTTQEYTVLGHAAIKYYSNSDRTGWSYNFYLPAEVYKKLVVQPAVMSYAFNAANDQEAAIEKFLKSYTDYKEPLMNYNSRFTTLNEFSGMRNTVVLIGGALSLIIGLIGVLNFINSILTSILTRRKEFAILQSIGMTGTQLKNMLMYEGIYYSCGTSVISLVLGIMISLLVVQNICSQIWFFSYHFIIWPVIIVLPFLLLLGAVIPTIIYKVTGKQNIVERLREAE